MTNIIHANLGRIPP